MSEANDEVNDEVKRMLADLRGIGCEAQCSSCGHIFPMANLEPEEGGEWWCHHCIRKWEEQWGQDFFSGQPKP